MDPARHARNLAVDGVTVVEEYCSPEQCARLRERLVAPDEQARADGARVDTPGGDSTDGVAGGGWDGEGGHPVKESATVTRPTRERVVADPAVRGVGSDPFVETVLARADGRRPEPVAVSARRDDGETDARPFQYRPATDGRYAATVYLTPVTDRADGPVAYVAGSHRTSQFTRAAERLVNRALGRKPRRAVFDDTTAPVVATGEHGTLVLADRRGYHCTLPRTTDGDRILLTTTYDA